MSLLFKRTFERGVVNVAKAARPLCLGFPTLAFLPQHPTSVEAPSLAHTDGRRGRVLSPPGVPGPTGFAGRGDHQSPDHRDAQVSGCQGASHHDARAPTLHETVTLRRFEVVRNVTSRCICLFFWGSLLGELFQIIKRGVGAQRRGSDVNRQSL